MNIHPQYETTFPYFDKETLIAASGTDFYETTRVEVHHERRRLVGYFSGKQAQRRRYAFRKAFRGIWYSCFDAKPFIEVIV